VVRVVSWNIGGGTAGWPDVLDLDADIALLQEARIPPPELRERVLPPVDQDVWSTAGPEVRRWRTAILPLHDAIEVEHLPTAPLGAGWGALGQSRAGSWTAATLRVEGDDPITLVSVYAAWERDVDGYGPIWADASTHRILSDLSPLLSRRNHRLLIAGDLNLLRGVWQHGLQAPLSDRVRPR
jgi:hypothetical protein